MEEQEPIMNSIVFHITEHQAELVAKYYDKDVSELEEYEICELLDRYIDELA